MNPPEMVMDMSSEMEFAMNRLFNPKVARKDRASLERHLNQLQKTHQAMVFNSRGFPVVTAPQDQYASMGLYFHAYTQAMAEVQQKLKDFDNNSL